MDRGIVRQLEAAAEQVRREQPTLSAFVDFDLLSEEVASKFRPFGTMGKDQIFGIRILEGGGRSKINFGLKDGHVVRLREIQPGRAFGYIPAGMPHHLTHEFGWWHANGTDEFYLCVPLVNQKVALVIFECNYPERHDGFNWYCLACYRPLHQRQVNIGRVGLEGYWEAEAAAIKEFNADLELRTCKGCGALHPLAYSVFAPENEKVW